MFIPAKIGKNFLVNRFSLFYFPKTFQKSIAVFCSCSLGFVNAYSETHH